MAFKACPTGEEEAWGYPNNSLDGYGMLWKSMENPMDNIYG
jgi:hypothetical protein